MILAQPDPTGIRIKFENGATDFIYVWHPSWCVHGRLVKYTTSQRVANFYSVDRKSVRVVKELTENYR